MSRQGLENILSCPFSYFWALSKLKNNIKQLKSIEKTMTHDEKEKKNEKWWNR